MKKLKHLFIEQQTGCPIATQDLQVNTKNRDAAIQHVLAEHGLKVVLSQITKFQLSGKVKNHDIVCY
jgi:hypothetical protein